MKLKPLLLGSATIAVLGLAMPAPGVLSIVNPAEAATNVAVSINFGTFYDRLSPHGSWVSYNNRYVWLPGGIDVTWRPYTLGHWVYTRRYGWMWVSDEPFGWATYHYGRWGHADDIGWYWVPGARWAPAWVEWRRSDSYVAWAPLTIDYGDDNIGVNVTVSKLPAFYWQVVEAPVFVSVDLSRYIIRDRDHTARVIGDTRPLGSVKFVNKVVVNNVIDIDFVEKKTKKKVVVREVEATDRPDEAGKANGDAVAVFAPEVKKEDANKKPKQVKSLDDVKKARKKAATGDADTATTKEQAGQPDNKAAQEVSQPEKKKKDEAAEQTDKVTGNKATQQVSQPEKKKDKAVRQQDQTAKKKKDKAGELAGQQGKKKGQASGADKKKPKLEPDQQSSVQPDNAAETKKKKKVEGQ